MLALTVPCMVRVESTKLMFHTLVLQHRFHTMQNYRTKQAAGFPSMLQSANHYHNPTKERKSIILWQSYYEGKEYFVTRILLQNKIRNVSEDLMQVF